MGVKNNRLTTEEFIACAVEVHGPRYDYSQTIYVNAWKPVKIICIEHGVFEKAPSNHRNGQGCPTCIRKTSGNRPTNTEVFISQAQAAHGDKYDYSQVVYSTRETPVTILCREHGPFQQRPGYHLRTAECCPDCRGEVYNTTSFIRYAIKKHGLQYNYSQVNYCGATIKVKIICPIHGPFMQMPSSHVSGNGCSQCNVKGRPQNSEEYYRAEFVKHHGLKYDYSLLPSAFSSATKVSIKCPAHGVFKQKVGNHYWGAGCPFCAETATRESWVIYATGKQATLYFIRLFNETESFYKVGITIKSVKQRFGSRTTLNGYKYEILALHNSSNAAAVYDWERSIIDTFAHLKYHPKVPFAGQSECFSSCDEILNIFPL